MRRGSAAMRVAASSAAASASSESPSVVCFASKISSSTNPNNTVSHVSSTMRAVEATPSRSAPSVNAVANTAKNSAATVAACASPQWLRPVERERRRVAHHRDERHGLHPPER